MIMITLLDYCNNYLNDTENDQYIKSIYELCFLYIGGFNLTNSETKTLKEYFKL